VRWIAGIIGLLAGNVVAMAILATVAHDGASQVIPDYYERAAHFDDALASAAAAHALGWHADLSIGIDAVEVRLRDASGAAVDGAKVRVSGYQRAHASEALDVELAAVGGGRYRAAIEARTGVHDLVITAERDGDRFTQRSSIDASGTVR
jgi:nitrogen fixation protein FixH